MTGKAYSTSAVTFSFWLPEFRRKTGILTEEKAKDEVKKLCLDDRYLPATSVVLRIDWISMTCKMQPVR